ncbi:lactate 2-monooxygenase [Cladophialophora psammophila CBS 110553]|uniref:Lactate 2-monooxygenase n=1 Tax=Cladophialophora psammophila CBS 110553 TaxID=1182543 RepID=W9WYV4_9EURO|nr:lactate 2-monooxygenase [Cladophialophora psammophila CBS 110553]EXJ73148.1 lactate 2-monooxygenase [Cladophialophora psammophila CBS 110553]
MSDPRIPLLYHRTTPHWQQEQRNSFWALNEGKSAPFNTRPDKLEAHAEESLSINGRHYAQSNAGNSWTHLANRQAFFRHRLIPHQLVDVNERDTTTTLFGHKIYHPRGELPVAKVAGQFRLPYALSTAGSSTIEDVAASNDEGRQMPDAVNVQGTDNDSPVRFFQLYLSHDDELAVSLLRRAVANGFTACILTTDTWQLGWRHDDVATSNYAFYRGIGADLGLADPIFQRRMEKAGIDPKKQPEEAGAMWIDKDWHGRAFSWEKIPWLIKTWKELSGGKPFCIKGIQSVANAQHCVDLGVDGIVVSNHAGRQVDGAIASLDALENIVNAGIGEKLTVMFDSGVRGASDVIKALCLGAKFVWVGRMWIYGLSIMGEEGVRRVMKCLLAKFDISMLTAGIRNVGEMQKDRLESYPKGYTLIAEKVKL